MLKSTKLNILVAFPYFSQGVYRLLAEKDPSTFRLIVDSGAFTAWNTGKEIRLDEYMKFLKTIPSHWDYKAVQLDVFGNPEGTYENYHRMRDAGFENVMPVFTRGDSLERLEEFYRHTNYIMFGGIVVGGQNTNYVKWFCEKNKGRDAHWLGFVNLPFMKHYRPKSVDSSSWSRGARFGTIEYYIGHGKIKIRSRKEFITTPPKEAFVYLKKSGFTDQEIVNLTKKEAWVSNGKYQPEVSAKSLAFFITAVGHVQRAVDIEKNLGTHVYLAASADGQVATLFESMKFLKSRGIL